MIKRTIAAILSLTLALSAFGCSDSSSSSDGSSQDTASSSDSQAAAPTTDEEWEKAMLEKSLVSYGNTSLIKDKIAKAQAGEEITIGYLGGSITEGYTVKPDECYASLTYNSFKEMYGKGDNVKYCNAGLSGTPSRLGILRMGRDLLPSEPDIVFVEYAVNDGTDFTYQEAYESIIRTLLERDIAVVLLFSVTKDDYSAQDYMKEIGTYYDLPMISYCDALRFLFENNRLKWEDFSNDEAHPNPEGHKLVAKMIDNYFKTVVDQQSDAYTLPAEPKNFLISYGAEMVEGDKLTADDLGSWKLGDTDVASFSNGWRHVKTGNDPIKFTIKGKNLFMIYKEVGGGNYATVEVIAKNSSGDEDSTLVNAVKANGWGGPVVAQIATSDTEQEYEISISAIPGDEEKSFQILGFGATK